MLSLKKIIFITCVALGAWQSANANDSAGTTAAGGIVLQKTAGIVMEDEKLQISKNLVVVDYIFQNITNHNITTQVFFPLPPYHPHGANETWDNEINPHLNPENAPLADFSVTVNNKPMPFQTFERAIYQGQDITAKLRQANIPLSPDLVAGNIPVAESKQIDEWQAKAKQLALLDANQQPSWQKQVLYEWIQKFPAHQTIHVQHRYRPSTGSFYSIRMANNDSASLLQADQQRINNLFTLDLNKLNNGSQFTNWLSRQVQKAADFSPAHCFNYQPGNTNCMYAMFYNVNYLLRTGANWAGPIRHFTLTLQYSQDGVVAYNTFYNQAKVTQQAGKTKIQISNLTPEKDLQILFGEKS